MKVGEVLFFAATLYLRSLQDLLVTESGCSGNDGAGNLFCGIKNLNSCCFFVAIKFFRMPMQMCCRLLFKMKSR